MADQLYFSRDTRVLIRLSGQSHVFEIPVLDGYSFSQATNSSEITLNEMADSDGNSRRARQMFNDSLAPAEWSFSTYAQPFYSASADQTAVEAPLWALLAGAATYDSVNKQYKDGANVYAQEVTDTIDKWKLEFTQSNKTTLGTADIFFIMGAVNPGANDTILAYKLEDCCVNEASIDFDMEGLATINWSGFGKQIKEVDVPKGANAAGAGAGNNSVWFDTDDKTLNYVNSSSVSAPVTKVESNNFIKNRLTKLTASTGSAGATQTSTSLLSSDASRDVDESDPDFQLDGQTLQTAQDVSNSPAESATTADRLSMTGTQSGQHGILLDMATGTANNTALAANSTTFMYSAYFKPAGNTRYVGFQTRQLGAFAPRHNRGVIVDLQTQTALNWNPTTTTNGNTGGQASTNVTVVDAGNGWTRVSFHNTAPPVSEGGTNVGKQFLGFYFSVSAPTLTSDAAPLSSSKNAGDGIDIAGIMVQPATAGTTPHAFAAAGETYTTGSSNYVAYDVTVTGGSININNNITYLTPETLGEVNVPLGHVTGTRNVSGSFNCYINQETNGSADLFKNLTDSIEVTNDFDLTFGIGDGGTGNNTPRIEMELPNCHFEIPTHSIEDVISLETTFNALPSNIDGKDELTVKYVSAE